jgi:hypothetical protein
MKNLLGKLIEEEIGELKEVFDKFLEKEIKERGFSKIEEVSDADRMSIEYKWSVEQKKHLKN